MMSIKLLLIEDDITDQMAFKRFVATEQLPYNYRIAGSVKEALAILHAEKFNIIVTDYVLGDGDVFDLLPSLNDAPVIVVTGSGDERVAVRAIKGGAYDYLIKDQDRNYLQALPQVVEKAIRYFEIEKLLHEKERYLAAIHDHIFEGIIMIDEQGIVRSLNPAGEAILGYTESELTGQSADVFLPPSFFTDDMALYHYLVEGRVQMIDVGFETTGTRKNGSTFPVEFTVSEISSGDRWLHLLACRDITERKQLEELLREEALRVRTENLTS